jgi:hypothetical protein
MTIIELLLILVVAGSAFVAAIVATVCWGGGWGIVAFVVAIAVWGVVLLLHDRTKSLPVCRKGCCRSDDYKFLGIQGGIRSFRCECGIEYRLIGSIFHEVDSAARLHPYMRRCWGVFWRLNNANGSVR